jgi:hypothetical protein
VVHCRSKYLEFKEDVEATRRREQEEVEELQKESEKMSVFSTSKKMKDNTDK